MEHAGRDHSKCNTIKWGAILAGAAVVAGAVMLAPGLIPGVSEALQGAVSWVSGLFSQKTVEAGTSTAAQQFMDMLGKIAASETTKQVAGAALVGGGAAYLLGGHSEAEQRHEHVEELARNNRESFADRENARLMQMKMVVQAAAAGNPQAQAMMAQMQGRG